MKVFVTVLVFLVSCSRIYAQKENNIWAFGHGFGLDFNGPGDPVQIATNMYSVEGCAAVCDKNGSLLFYSNGHNVWNRFHTIMPNGSDLIGNYIGPEIVGSSTQGVTIIQNFKNPNQYYLFVLDAGEDIDSLYLGYLRYSIIDMALNGGMGDVIIESKNTIIDSALGEQMTSIKGNGCSVWLVVSKHSSDEFHSFKIDRGGLIVNPVISHSGVGGGQFSHIYGEMKATWNGNYLANIVCYNWEDFLIGIEMHEFDRISGGVSKGKLICREASYGFDFSPLGRFLYAEDRKGVFSQYDLNRLADIDSFNYRKINLINKSRTYSFRRGPESSLYTISYESLNKSYLSRITYPDREGLDCLFQEKMFEYKDDPIGFIGLGSTIVNPITVDTGFYFHDTLDCLSKAIELNAREADDYLWSTGETRQTVSISESSKVWVTAKIDACRVNVDTFVVTLPKIFSKLHDTIICRNQTITLDALTDGAEYLWQNGSRSSEFATMEAGHFWVNVKTQDCDVSDTLVVKDGNFTFDLGKDITVCREEELILQPNIVGDYLWQDGSEAPKFNATESGQYWVRVYNGSCFATDTINITKEKCTQCISIPNTFTPNNDGKNDAFRSILSCPVLKYSLKIVNRYGEIVFETQSISDVWNGKFNNRDAEIGVYYYLIEAVFDKPKNSRELYKGDITLLR